MKTGDLLAGLVLIGVGSFIIHQALRLDYVNEFGPGPGFLPFWIGAGLVSLSAILLAMTVLAPERGRLQEQSSRAEVLRGLAAWVAVMVGISLLEQLGFLASYVLLTFFLVWIMARRSAWVSLIAAAACGAVLYFLFAGLLDLPLPPGPWGF
jgi:putative tricarboxylic transport membrane protein